MNITTTVSRRSFLKTAAFAAGALSLPASSWAQVKGANETIRIGVIGFRSRGSDHIKGYQSLPNVTIAALCDVDKDVLARGIETIGKKGPKPEGYTDLRKLLENKSIDAVSIATPNHWHSLATIWACQAGKDVYVEKPISNNVWEGRQAVLAAEKYKRIVQAGTQSRSSVNGIGAAVKWVREGNLGKIQIARGLCYKPRGSIGKTTGPQTVPATLDYDLWCGPAPLDPPRRTNPKFGPVHYDWHWFWNYGCGDLGNQGIHQMDISRWFLGEEELSPRVWSVGGRLGYDDDGETPNTQIVYHDYAKAPLIFEVRGLPEKTGSKDMDRFPSKEKDRGGSVAVVIHCEGGQILVPNYKQAITIDKNGQEIKRWADGGDNEHYANFIRALRARDPKLLNGPILEGHLSSALCHTGNISYRLGAKSSPDAIREQIKGDRDASATFDRMAEHLKANDVDLNLTKATLGPVLKMDPKTETFPGNAAANALCTRVYRAPFTVPEKV